ncbi:hypothetical protein ACHZ98_32690 [Streptomyces sp. MAR4 CNY-716]
MAGVLEVFAAAMDRRRDMLIDTVGRLLATADRDCLCADALGGIGHGVPPP